VDVALDVRLRPGTRVSHHQHRFRSRAGARRADSSGTAPFARAHPEHGLDLASHPHRVAEAWAEAMAGRDLDVAVALYAPDARIHTPEATLAGRSQLLAYLDASPLRGLGRPAAVHGSDGLVSLRWDTAGGSEEVFVAVRHGEIAEQWVAGAVPEELAGTAAAVPETIDVVAQGDVPDAAVAYAREKIARLAWLLDEPVLHARLKLSLLADPAVKRPAVAQVNLDVNGELVRAHVRAHTFGEAADLLEERLRDRLEHRREHRQERDLGLPPEPGTWRHRALPAERRSYFPRPAEDREVVCHKTFAAGELTPDEAAFDLEVLDYDFYLFDDLASGEDSLLWRDDCEAYHLARLHLARRAAGDRRSAHRRPRPRTGPRRGRRGGAPERWRRAVRVLRGRLDRKG
jgi:ribosome-associated translation inhibitor RaiA